MNEYLLNIDIESNETLLETCDVLHDSTLDTSKIKYNESEGTWEAPFEREFFEDPSKIEYQRKYLIFTKAIFPIVHSVLTLTGIKSFKFEDKEKIQIYTFNECQIKNDIYEFLFCENMSMYFTFEDKPTGNLKDHYLLEKQKSLLTIGKPFKN